METLFKFPMVLDLFTAALVEAVVVAHTSRDSPAALVVLAAAAVVMDLAGQLLGITCKAHLLEAGGLALMVQTVLRLLAA